MLHEGQGFHFSEAGKDIRVMVSVGNVPGSESAADNRTVNVGTWESQSVPKKPSASRTKARGGKRDWRSD